MDIETKKLIVTSLIQLFLGTGAWFFGWRIARAQIQNQRSDLRIKLFDQRYAVYSAFKEFVEHCALHDRYSEPALAKFQKETQRFEFLFGPEIRKYHREVIANALATRGILEELPCEDRPVVGGLVGYFQGSTVLTDLPSLQSWFVQQHVHDLRKCFMPYLDYGSAGVDVDSVTVTPPDLPEPPLVKRRIGHEKTANQPSEPTAPSGRGSP